MKTEKTSDNSFMIIDKNKSIEFVVDSNVIIVYYSADEDSKDYLQGTFSFGESDQLYTYFNSLLQNSNLVSFESAHEYIGCYAEDCCNFFSIQRNKDHSIDLGFTIETLYGEREIITNDVVVPNEPFNLDYCRLLNMCESIMVHLNSKKEHKPIKSKKIKSMQ